MLFDTRYFWAVLTSRDGEGTRRLKALFDRSDPAYVSSVTVYELSRLTLAREGAAAARLRAESIAKEFEVVPVDGSTAEEGAEIGHRLRVPMADALIMATAKRLREPCVTDDPHFAGVKTVWA